MTYWMVGYGLSFGRHANAFCGFGDFFFEPDLDEGNLGSSYTHYVFQVWNLTLQRQIKTL